MSISALEFPMRIRLLAGTAIAALMAGSSAYAADLGVGPQFMPPPPPAPQSGWTGCHMGINYGLGAGHVQWTDTQADGNIDSDLLATTARTASTEMSGGVAGGQIGCDLQFGGNWVMGIAGSLNWSDITGTNQDQFNNAWTLRDHIDWYSTVTGRAGFAVGNVLIYSKGGVVFAHNAFEIENSGVTLGAPADVRTGWTVGTGIEWAFAPNWSAVIEGGYYSFPSKTETFNSATAVAGAFVNPPFTINVQPSFETLTLGVNYRFGAGSSPY
jgi:outer membrane immunogenic protein